MPDNPVATPPPAEPGVVRWADFVPDLVRLQPAPGSFRVAVRATLIMLVALLTLESTGHLGWALYATFGAFASIYGGRRPWPGRWRVQAGLGLLLTAAVTSGALAGLSPHRGWVSVPLTAAWAGLAASLSDRYGWRPPGPLFLVFATSACASVPTVGVDVGAALGVSAAAAALAVLLGVLENAWSGRRGRAGTASPRDPSYLPHRRRVQAVRCVAVVAVAGALATLSGIGHPYWAMVSSVVPLTVATLHAQLLRGAQRTVGTLVGLGLAAALLAAPLPAVVVILVVVAMQAAAELLVGRNYGAALVAITCLALLVGQLAHPQPLGTLLLERLLQTLLGVAVGMVAAVLTRHAPTAAPQRS